MRIDTVENKVYSVEDLKLPENADLKEKVLNNLRDINTDYQRWYDPIYEGFKEDMTKYGVEVSKIYFSGFYSQGDGAIFEVNRLGIIDFLKTNKLLTRFKPLVHEIKKDIAKNYYGLPLSKLKSIHQFIGHDDIAIIRQSGHYYHEKSYTIDYNYSYDYLFTSVNDSFDDYLRNFIETKAKELYRSLEKYYDELNSDEAVMEAIEANEYEFDGDGNIYN